jgi:hypothetical protein
MQHTQIIHKMQQSAALTWLKWGHRLSAQASQHPLQLSRLPAYSPGTSSSCCAHAPEAMLSTYRCRQHNTEQLKAAKQGRKQAQSLAHKSNTLNAMPHCRADNRWRTVQLCAPHLIE